MPRLIQASGESPDLTPKPTRYHDVTFRSRLEARWAVFFDELEISWDYEIDQYNDGRTFYTPDFWLEDLECFFEVKPTPTYNKRKIEMLVQKTGSWVYVGFEFPSPELVVARSAHCWFRGGASQTIARQYRPWIWVDDPEDGVSLQDAAVWAHPKSDPHIDLIDGDKADMRRIRQVDPEMFVKIDAASLVARNYHFGVGS